MDTALIRLFTARIRLGMFDPPEMVPYAKIDEKELDSPEHRALARKLANESMVLLKNDGTLPLKSGITKIAVVGPLADQTKVLLGNYNGTPTHSVSMLDGLKAEFPQAKITFVPGTQFLRNDGNPVPGNLLTTAEGKPGLKAEYGNWEGIDLDSGAKPAPLTSRVEPNVDLSESNLPAEAGGQKVPRRAMDGLSDAAGFRRLSHRYARRRLCQRHGGRQDGRGGVGDPRGRSASRARAPGQRAERSR